MVKNPPANVGDAGDKGLIPESGRSPGEGNGNPFTPVFLPRESHGQRSLAGYSPQGRKELDVTERLMMPFRGTWAARRPCVVSFPGGKRRG